MKFPFLSAVVGTSFRPNTAASAKPGLAVTARPEPENPVDPHAVLVELNGEQLGYLPRALAARLQGGPWAGEIVDVFGSDRLGIRVRILGPLTEQPDNPNPPQRRYTIDSTPAAKQPLPRSTALAPTPVPATAPATAPAFASTGEVTSSTAPVILDDNEIVRARSGRFLGTFVGVEAGKVVVRTDDGRDVSYPETLIVRERRVS